MTMTLHNKDWIIIKMDNNWIEIKLSQCQYKIKKILFFFTANLVNKIEYGTYTALK